MTFWAYLLHCRGGAYYVGHTDNLDHRVAQHQTGAIAGFTADHLPVALVWSQDFPTRHEAKEAEKRIKGWTRAKKMALIRGDWDRISTLAKGKNGPSTSSGQAGLKEPVTEIANPFPHPACPELVEGLSFSLLCHPQTPAKLVRAVTVDMTYPDDDVLIEFRVDNGEVVKWPEWQNYARRDELWRTTCFELFIKLIDDPAYFELNLSPSSAWAAYRFTSNRAGMEPLALDCPPIVCRDYGGEDFMTWADIELNFLKPGSLQIALSAVIEEIDGTKSYWALAHPPEGPPDFHHPDCFALTLPAPEQS